MTARTWTVHDAVAEYRRGAWRLGTVTGIDEVWLAIRWDDDTNHISFRHLPALQLRTPEDVPVDEQWWTPQSVRDQLVRQEAAGRIRAMAAELDHDESLQVLANLLDDLVGPGGGGWLHTGSYVGTTELVRAARALLAPAPQPATTS